jgi:hypothetical protein
MVVWEYANDCAGELGTVDQAGVAEFVENDDVVPTAKRPECSDCGGVTAGEDERSFGVLERSEAFLQAEMGGQGATDQS